MEKKGLRVAEPRVLRLDQWGSEKGAEIRETLTLKRVRDSEWVQCETGQGGFGRPDLCPIH